MRDIYYASEFVSSNDAVFRQTLTVTKQMYLNNISKVIIHKYV